MKTTLFTLFAGLALAASGYASPDSDFDELVSLGFAGFDRNFDPSAALSADEAMLDLRDLSASENEGSNNVAARAVEPHGDAHRIEKRGSFKKSFSAVITFYTGYDLRYPACQRQSHWDPTDNSLVTALTVNWPGKRPPCGSFLKLTAPNGRHIITRFWDLCAGCQGYACDLTKRGFKALYPLDVGRKAGIRVQVVQKPFKKWTKAIEKIYGPEKQ